MASSAGPAGVLVIEGWKGPAAGRAYYAAKWRAGRDGRQMKRRLGPAWLEPDRAGGWRRRKGGPRDGALDERAAYVAMAEVIAEQEAEDRHTEDRAAERARRQLTFRALADAWLDHCEHVKQLKPSTLRDLRSVLAAPGTPRRRGQGTLKARVLTALGDLPAAEVSVLDVEGVLRQVAADGASPRTVNRYREVLRAVFNFGMTEASGFGLTENPASKTALRRVDKPQDLEVYAVEQIEALARAAEAGLWRTPSDWQRDEATFERYRAEDAQLAELLRLACYTGLRRGELVVLRWSDVRWSERVLVVRRALSDGEVVRTKSGRPRYVPLGDQALAALERLSRRGDFTQAEDYVFINDVGEHLDPSALRRRYKGARDAAGLPPLRFHDLRHTAGSLMVRVMDPASVKEILGHADLKTTERYLHAQRASSLADSATRAFTPVATEGEHPLLVVLRRLTPEQRDALLA